MNLPPSIQQTALETLSDFVLKEYGINDASPITLLAQMAWDASYPIQHRMRAAIALLPYCHQSIRAAEMMDPNQGPSLIVQVLGNVSVSPEGKVLGPEQRPALEIVHGGDSTSQ